MTSSLPIGIFDSGIGGLTVMKQIMNLLPEESLCYFGDTARVPYGGKSKETIIRYALENASFLMDQKIKALVVACNTATAAALEELKAHCPVPVLGVISPGAEMAVQTSLTKRIAVLGTRSTIQSGIYPKEIHAFDPKAFVLPLACPLLVPLVEENYIHHPATRMILWDYLSPLQEHAVDTLLLGCTHYPMLLQIIQEIVGPEITVLNSAQACALKLQQLLEDENLRGPENGESRHHYFVSDDAIKFEMQARSLLGVDLEVTLLTPHSLLDQDKAR